MTHDEHYDKLVPLKIDLRPRYIAPEIDIDISESGLYQALNELRQLAHARGYTERPIEFADCLLVYSLIFQKRIDEFKKDERFAKMTTQGVTPAVLKTFAAWALCFGKDAFVSAPNW